MSDGHPFTTSGKGPSGTRCSGPVTPWGSEIRISGPDPGHAEKFIAFGIKEITAWEKAGLVHVPDKEKAAATILALSEGLGILRNSLNRLDSLEEIARSMRQSAMETLGAGTVCLDLENDLHQDQKTESV